MLVIIKSHSKLILRLKCLGKVSRKKKKKINENNRRNLMKCLSIAVNVISFTFLSFLSLKLKFSRYYRTSVAKTENKGKRKEIILRQKVFIAFLHRPNGERKRWGGNTLGQKENTPYWIVIISKKYFDCWISPTFLRPLVNLIQFFAWTSDR